MTWIKILNIPVSDDFLCFDQGIPILWVILKPSAICAYDTVTAKYDLRVTV